MNFATELFTKFSALPLPEQIGIAIFMIVVLAALAYDNAGKDNIFHGRF